VYRSLRLRYGKVIRHYAAPVNPFVLVFPFNDFLDGKNTVLTFETAAPRRKSAPSLGISLGAVKVDHPETASAYIGYGVSLLQGFIFSKSSDYTVKVNRLT
jgi:hypothetical protein